MARPQKVVIKLLAIAAHNVKCKYLQGDVKITIKLTPDFK